MKIEWNSNKRLLNLLNYFLYHVFILYYVWIMIDRVVFELLLEYDMVVLVVFGITLISII